MNSAPTDLALAPWRSRKRPAMKEREILRVVATVKGRDRTTAMDKAMREVLVWAKNRSGGTLPKEAWDGQEFEHLTGSPTLGTRIESNDINLWAIRNDDPDKTVPKRTWTTEVTLGYRAKDSLQLGVRQLVSTTEETLSISPHVPGLVQQLVERCKLRIGTLSLIAQPWRIKTDSDAKKLIEILESRDRKLPVVVATGDERAEDPSKSLIDTIALARATLGIAYVVEVPAEQTYRLSDAFGRTRSTYHGGARIYLPGFDSASNPYEHRLILSDALRSNAERAKTEFQRIAAGESLRQTRLGRDVIAFAAVRSAARKIEQEQRSIEGASDADQIKVLQRRITALEKENEEAKSEAYESLDLATSEEQRAKQAEAQLYAAQMRIQGLESRLVEQDQNPDKELTPPDSWDDFVEWCDENFAGRCALSGLARRGCRRPEFEDVALAGRCIRWLATTCLDNRINGRGNLANTRIKNEKGIKNALCGSDTFDFDYQGRRLQAESHIKNGGNTRDPRRCLRIYYGYDETTQQIIIADMPAHRRTGAS